MVYLCMLLQATCIAFRPQNICTQWWCRMVKIVAPSSFRLQVLASHMTSQRHYTLYLERKYQCRSRPLKHATEAENLPISSPGQTLRPKKHSRSMGRGACTVLSLAASHSIPVGPIVRPQSKGALLLCLELRALRRMAQLGK